MVRLAAIAGVILFALAPHRAAALEAQTALNAVVGPGVDTNPRRTVGVRSPTDGFLTLTTSAKGRLLLGESGALSGRYDLGLKKFWQTVGEDVAVQQLDLDYGVRLGRAVVGGSLAGKLRLSRDALRDYGDSSAEAFLEWSLLKGLSLRLNGGAHAFRYWPDGAYDSVGPTAGLALRLNPSRRYGFAAGTGAGWPYFRGGARGQRMEATGERRRDRLLTAWLSGSYRGPIALQAGYLFADLESNSFGEGTQRHRLSGAMSAKLPFDLYLMVQLAWQFIRYSDGIILSKDLLLLDDESQSSAVGKLAWAFSESLEVEARYAVYWIELPPKVSGPDALPLTYTRQIAVLGLAWKFDLPARTR